MDKVRYERWIRCEPISITKAKITRLGKKVLVTLDVGKQLIKEMDGIRENIGVHRGA